MIVVIALLGFVLVAGLFIYLTVLDAGRWRTKMEAVLFPLGFQVCLSREEKAALAQRLLIVNPRHHGKRLLLHLYRRASPDGRHVLYFCDYQFASASGKARGGQSLLICLVSRELDLPRFSIASIPQAGGSASKLFHKLSESYPMPGLDRLKTGESELDQCFYIYADAGNSKQLTALLEPINKTLCARAGVCLDAQGDSLILSSIEIGASLARHTFDSQKLIRLIGAASDLFETFAPETAE